MLVHSLLRASGEYWRETRTVSKYGYFFNGFRTGFWSGEVLGKRMAVFYVFLVTHVPTVADVQSMPVVFTAICALFWAVHGAYLPLVKDALQGEAQTDFKSLDSVHIYLMMLTLVLGQVLSDRIPDVSDVEHGLEIVHALNLLPSWIRVLPLLQLSKYFGTLLMTICGMLKDALRFFMLVSVFSFGFSCALTPVLFVQGEEREQHGLLWAFWIIVGDDAGISAAQDRANQPEVALAEVRGPVPPLHARAGRQRAACEPAHRRDEQHLRAEPDWPSWCTLSTWCFTPCSWS